MPAMKIHHTETDTGRWDGAGNERRLEPTEANVKLMAAWIDPNVDPDSKAAVKLPHHVVGSDGKPGAANIGGVSAAIAALNGARGGVDIPAAQRRAVWNHLAAHLRDADREPPPLRG